MTLFIVVLLIVGTVSAIFFDVDTALKAGKFTVEFWIITGLILTILGPFIGIFRLVKAIVQKVYHLFYRKEV